MGRQCVLLLIFLQVGEQEEGDLVQKIILDTLTLFWMLESGIFGGFDSVYRFLLWPGATVSTPVSPRFVSGLENGGFFRV